MQSLCNVKAVLHTSPNANFVFFVKTYTETLSSWQKYLRLWHSKKKTEKKLLYYRFLEEELICWFANVFWKIEEEIQSTIAFNIF